MNAIEITCARVLAYSEYLRLCAPFALHTWEQKWAARFPVVRMGLEKYA